MRAHWAGEEWEMLPERALWWPRARTLIAADLHLGKPAAFRAAGVPVPEEATAADLNRLSTLIARLDAGRLLILGDFLHARTGRAPETMHAVESWRTRHAGLPITLVRGNHDWRAGDPPCEWNIRCVDEPFPATELDADSSPSLRFAHHTPSPEHEGSDEHVMHGHIHPCVVMDGPACAAVRAPCFWFGETAAVLPAFGSFTGCAPVRPRRGDSVFVIGPGAIAQAHVPGPRRSGVRAHGWR